MKTRARISISQTLFTLNLLVFFFIILNGYLLNLATNHRANFGLVLVGVVAEIALALFLARRWIAIEFDPLELAGYLVTVVGVWFYFVAASLPTLLPPTQSEDAARVYLQVLFTYPEGKLVSWYPAGGTFLVAALAQWLGWDPLRLLHPVAASFVALSAGAVYGIMCALLPPSRAAKIVALGAPALLFVPWRYFAGIINEEQYFFAQAFAQLFTLAALWFTANYIKQPNGVFAGLVAVALLGVVVAYPIFVALPLGVFAIAVLMQAWNPGSKFVERSGVRARRGGLLVLALVLGLMLVAALVLQVGGILELRTVQISLTADVGVGGVATPSLDTFGGVIFLLLALGGVPIAWRAGWTGKLILAFLIVWGAQLLALNLLQPIVGISGYRVDKTFYIFAFPLALLAALTLGRGAELSLSRLRLGPRIHAALWIVTVLVITGAIVLARPPSFSAPFTEAELATARWARANLETYQIHSLDPARIRAYWLAFGLWNETLPNEWFQWIPPGQKLGPATLDEWLDDPGWGQYLMVRDLDSVRGSPVRLVHQSGASAIVQKARPTVSSPSPTRVSRWHYGSTLKLIGYDLSRERAAAGDVLEVTTYVEFIYPPPATVAWRAQIVDRMNRSVSRVERAPFDDKYPVQRWPVGQRAREVWSLPIDSSARPGVYEIRLSLFRREGGELVDAFPILANGMGNSLPAVPLAKIKIPAPTPKPDELRTAQALDARVGDSFSLAHYSLKTDRATRRVLLTLYWQSLTKTDTDYKIFVHLLDGFGTIIAQMDREPREGMYPTSIWDPQEVIKDEYSLSVPSGEVPSAIVIGMYSPVDLKRLPVGTIDHVALRVDF